MNLVLSGKRDRRKFLLDPTSGVWTRTSETLTDRGVVGFSGYADIRSIGLTGRRSVFVAVYVENGRCWMRVDDVTINLDDPEIQISRTASYPSVKGFRIQKGDALLVQCRYWWSDFHEWPDDDELDIFLYVPTHFGTPTDRARFVSSWSLMQTGLSAIEVANRLETDSAGAVPYFQQLRAAFVVAMAACFFYFLAVFSAWDDFGPKGASQLSSVALLVLLVLHVVPVVGCGLFHFKIMRDSDFSNLQRCAQFIAVVFGAPLLGWLAALIARIVATGGGP